MTSGLVLVIAAMGGIFTLGECTARDMRQKEDPINAAIGGCAAGLLAGIKSNFFFVYAEPRSIFTDINIVLSSLFC